MHLKNVPDLVFTCLVLHNMCIIFGDSFWREEWVREAKDEVHNGLAIPKVFIHARMNGYCEFDIAQLGQH